MQDALNSEYDYVVIGAGPAGLLAAYTLAQSGKNKVGQAPFRIALLDKRDPWREPVACAEAVHAEGLRSLVPNMPDAWVREPVDGVIFVSPDGTKVPFERKGSGYLIDRALMHRNLAQWCQAAGVHCNFRARATEVSKFENGYRQIKVEGDTPLTLTAKVVIDASGPGLGFGQGEPIVHGNFDAEPAIFALVSGLKYPVNFIQLFFGKTYAPGGYAWLFPRDEHVANVGLVVGKAFSKQAPARRLLQEFLAKTYPEAKVEHFHGGVIPCGWTHDPLAHENLIKAGDSANMVHPLSRAGILESMLGGKLAAEAALKVIDLKTESEKEPFYAAYKAAWDADYGNNHYRIHKAKKGFSEITDATFDRAAHGLAALPKEKVSMARIFFTTLWHSPSLLWKMRSLFLG